VMGRGGRRTARFVVNLLRAEIQLVLCARRRLVAINAFDKVVQSVALNGQRGVLVERVERTIEGVQQVLAFVADGLLNNSLAESQVNWIHATEREMIEWNQLVFIIHRQSVEDLSVADLPTDVVCAIQLVGRR